LCDGNNEGNENNELTYLCPDIDEKQERLIGRLRGKDVNMEMQSQEMSTVNNKTERKRGH
jgi:hypothetical protein